MPGLLSTSDSSTDAASEADRIQVLKDYQAELRGECQEKHMSIVRTRVDAEATARKIELQWQVAFNKDHVRWLDEQERKDPLPDDCYHALRRHYDHHVQVARNNAAVDVLDMLALTVGERFLLVSATVPST